MKQILIVEDSKLFICVLKDVLKRTGCSILVAKNGKEALKIATEQIPDLILMDLKMEVMEGDACCRQIKSSSETKQIPVIMVTAAGKSEDIEKCINAGCDDYLTKPVDKVKLLDKVGHFLNIPAGPLKGLPIYAPTP